MKRLHVHFTVGDLDRAIVFYSGLFGQEPQVRQDDYAKWMVEDPCVNFAVSTGTRQKGFDHLGIQVEDEDELEEIETRLPASRRDGGGTARRSMLLRGRRQVLDCRSRRNPLGDLSHQGRDRGIRAGPETDGQSLTPGDECGSAVASPERSRAHIGPSGTPRSSAVEMAHVRGLKRRKPTMARNSVPAMNSGADRRTPHNRTLSTRKERWLQTGAAFGQELRGNAADFPGAVAGHRLLAITMPSPAGRMDASVLSSTEIFASIPRIATVRSVLSRGSYVAPLRNAGGHHGVRARRRGDCSPRLSDASGCNVTSMLMGSGSRCSRAKRGNEKPQRGWYIHRTRLGREASQGIADTSASGAAVHASDAPDSESGGGPPRRPELPSPCVPAA